MKSNKILGVDLDVLGTGASIICAIHCAATPLVLTYGLLGGLGIFENEVWDISLIVVSVVIAIVSLFRSYSKSHGNKSPLIYAFVGFAIIAIGHLGPHSSAAHYLTAFGGLMVAFSHVYNASLRQKFKRAY